MSELTGRFDLPLDVDAPAAARRGARAMLTGWGYHHRDWLDTAMVVISELVANAVRHGGGCLSLDLHARDGQVTIGVADGSAVLPRRRDADDDGGRGLAVVEALADRWGVHDHHEGKRVWAQLPRHP